MVKGLEEQIPTEEYGTVLLCDNSKACVEAVEAGKADVAAGTWAGLEYYIYETGSTLVTSLLPGRTWTRTSPCPGTATPSCWPP